jgi:hypothetical protein
MICGYHDEDVPNDVDLPAMLDVDFDEYMAQEIIRAYERLLKEAHIHGWNINAQRSYDDVAVAGSEKAMPFPLFKF